ncbi:MAG TPA: Calx-beta domain-containing protein [Candidatus Acidoferrum sp.]|nr:Calx-beta domain-containing protein [Candidatus Acidoferrum sp.]
MSIKSWNPLGLLPLGLLAGLGLAATSAWAQPANDRFQNATPIGGQFGSVVGSNLGATNQPGEPSHAGNPATWSIWYAWTAPESGEVTFDTLGSTNAVGQIMDTVLAVYTGSTVSQLLQVAANDDYYPLRQQLEESQTIGTGPGNLAFFVPIIVPFAGPSVLRFNAVAGTTYYIAVDSKVNQGTISLNWAFRPSGAFRFATESFDYSSQLFGTSPTPVPLYMCSEAESLPDWESTHDSYYRFDPEGVLVTVTRVAGSSGRMFVDYATRDGTAVAGFDYKPISGTLVFDDFEMSKTLVIAMGNSLSFSSRDFSVVLSNPRPAPLESPNVSPPRLDAPFATATVRIQSLENPQSDPDQYPDPTSGAAPTHDVYNFLHKNFRVPRDINSYWTRVQVSVARTLKLTAPNANDNGASINYRVNGVIGVDIPPQEFNNFFPLNPGSEYAIPEPSQACIWIYPWQNVTNWNNWDFQMSGNTPNADGTVTVPQSGLGIIEFLVRNDTLTKFNKDFNITIYRQDHNANQTVGEINECHVTILFDDATPPAGSVDEFYNTDFGSQMKPPVSTIPSNQAHPGTDGTVWDLAVQPDGKTLLVGEFATYNGTTRSCITRVLPAGAVDLTFDPGSGANDGVISKLGVLPDGSGRMMIGGSFTHFNGGVRKFIARLLPTGQQDTTFNPLQDPDGTIWALAVQTNNQVVIGGDFTAIGTVPRAHIARLNADGSLDTSFDPGGNAPNDTVWSVAVQPDGKILIGGQFTSLGSLNLGGLARLNSDGTADTAFNANLVPGVDGTVYTVVLQNGSDIVIGGEFQHVGIAQRTRIARLKGDATVDNTFNSGTGSDDTIYNISAQPDGSMYVGGIFSSYNGTRRSGLARLYPDGTADTTFLDTAYNQFAGLHRRYFERQAWPGPGPDPNPDPRPFVYASQVLPDGNVVVGGGFKQIGGGQADASIRFDPDYPYTTIDTNVWTEPKSRDGVRNRNNFARLIGGSTPGPGNIGLLYTNYFVNKSQLSFDVDLIRTNGTLGYSSANFAAQAGLAQSGVDYVYNSAAPVYVGSWWPSDLVTPFFPDTPRALTRAHSDGFSGTNELPVDVYGHYWFGYTPAKVTIPIKNSGVPGDINTIIQMANPSGADQFFLGGQNIPLGNALGVSAAPFTIVDDSQSPGVISFASATYYVNEQGTNAVITLVRTNGSAGYPSVVFSTSDGTGRAGSNYTAVLNKRVSFAPGITVLTNIIVPIIDDGVSEPNGLTVNLRLSSVQGATLGRSTATLQIIDNDFAPGYVTFSSASYTTNESAGAVTLTVTRSGANRGTVTVQCATTNVTAINGVNYRAITNTLSWDDGDATPRFVTVPLIHDGLVGSNTTFKAFLYNPTVNTANSPGTVLAASPTTALVTILDDDFFGHLQFSSPSYVVNEDGGYATLTVTRTGGAAQALSVNYATSDGSAVSSGTLPNYVATSGTLTFNPGEVSKSFTVPLLDDGVVDPLPQSFFFFVTLSGLTPPGAALGSPASAAVQIRDAQTFNQPSGSPDTSFVPIPGFDGNVLSVSLQPNGQIIAAGAFATVDNFPRRGVARLNSDSSLDGFFLAGLSGADGQVNASLVQSDGRILLGGSFTNFNGIPVNRLARLQGNGALDSSFTLSAGGDNTIFALAETFVPDRRLLIGGSFINMNGFPHAGLARLNNNGSLDPTFSQALNINGTVYAIAVYPTNTIQAGKILIGGGFSAINGQGYNGLARLNPDGTLDITFNPGGAGANDIVRALAIQLDGRVVAGGAFTSFKNTPCGRITRLNLDGSVDATFNTGPGADDTVAALAIQQDNRIVAVGQFTHANGVSRSRITRLLPDGTVDPSINFGLGADNFINALAIQPDGMLVIGGGFTQFDSLARPHLARLYGGSVVGSGNFEFTAGNYTIDEDSTNAVITIRRRGGTSGNVSIGFATADNTAVAGINYSNVSTTLYFPVGETIRAVTIPVRQDFQITPDLIVNLALSNPLPPSTLGDQPVATLTIFNDDCAVSFDAAAYRINENVPNGLGDLFAVRQGSSRRLATVDFMTTTNGTALSGVNYLPLTNTVVFQPGQSNALIQVPILATPGVAEGDVTVTMVLTNANHALLFAPDQATLTIVDVDQAPGLFFFSRTNYVVGEGDGFAYVTVLRTNGHTGVVNLNFDTVPGSATPGLKYGSTNFLMSFQDGETAKTVAIPIFEENQVEGTETFFVTLSDPGGAITNILGPAVVPVAIIDDDFGVGFSSPIYISTETDPSVTLVVNRVGTNGTTTVSFSTTNGTAVAGTNYVAASGTLSFAPGETLKTFSVSLLHDPRVTGPLAFNVNLFAASAPTQIFTNNPATVTVNDADPGLAFTNANFYTSKSATNVLISVLRSNANTGIVSVNYSTVEGTALAGVDFIPTNGVLTFSNGIALQGFNVPIINNQEVAPDRTFFVNIFNPTAPGQILEPSTAAVTITNDLTGLSFSSPAYKVNENGVQALITVLRTGFTNSTVSVDYFTADGSARAGINYSNVSGTFTFTNGETAKTFAVPVIDDSLVTGDKTVLLGLRNAVGHVVLVNPSASVLTMVETDGSLIVPAGTALLSESFSPPNGSIDPGETVTILFAFRNSAGTNTVNLVATLLATNGITSPSGPQTYGVLAVHGPSVSRPFTFTANATNGQVIQATFQFTDGTSPTNFAVVSLVVGQTTALFSNTVSIVINDNTNASPYPSSINVGSLPGLVSKAVVTFTNLNHDSPADIAALLVSPAGQKSLLMAKCGSDLSVRQVTLTFDDAAGSALPQSAQLTSGTYRPTSFAFATPPFPPALTPPAPYANNLAAFNGFNPNGVWSLYIIDDQQLYSGIISNGWLLKLTTSAPILGNADLALSMTASPNPVIASSNLTYTLTLTNFGPSAAANIFVTNTMPPGAGYVSSSPALGTASTNGAGLLVWSISALTNGGTASLTLVVRPPAAGFITNSAFVTNSVVDLNPDDNVASAVVLVTTPIADLAVSLAGVPNPVLSGNNLTYTITVTNLGPATATSVSVTDTLPPGVNFISATPPGYALIGSQVTFANLGDLGSGGQLAATIVVRPAVGGTLTNSVTTASGIPDPLKVNNSASIKTVVIPVVVTLTQSGANLIISWPSDAVGYYLETTTSLQPPAVWTPVTSPQPIGVGGQQTVTLPLGNGTQFYRVHGQAQ